MKRLSWSWQTLLTKLLLRPPEHLKVDKFRGHGPYLTQIDSARSGADHMVMSSIPGQMILIVAPPARLGAQSQRIATSDSNFWPPLVGHSLVATVFLNLRAIFWMRCNCEIRPPLRLALGSEKSRPLRCGLSC
jgi:hypothetical protein